MIFPCRRGITISQCQFFHHKPLQWQQTQWHLPFLQADACLKCSQSHGEHEIDHPLWLSYAEHNFHTCMGKLMILNSCSIPSDIDACLLSISTKSCLRKSHLLHCNDNKWPQTHSSAFIMLLHYKSTPSTRVSIHVIFFFENNARNSGLMLEISGRKGRFWRGKVLFPFLYAPLPQGAYMKALWRFPKSGCICLVITRGDIDLSKTVSLWRVKQQAMDLSLWYLHQPDTNITPSFSWVLESTDFHKLTFFNELQSSATSLALVQWSVSHSKQSMDQTPGNWCS